MKRFELHVSLDQSDLQRLHPMNSYDFETIDEILDDLKKLFNNDISGINYIQIIDHNFDSKGDEPTDESQGISKPTESEFINLTEHSGFFEIYLINNKRFMVNNFDNRLYSEQYYDEVRIEAGREYGNDMIDYIIWTPKK